MVVGRRETDRSDSGSCKASSDGREHRGRSIIPDSQRIARRESVLNSKHSIHSMTARVDKSPLVLAMPGDQDGPASPWSHHRQASVQLGLHINTPELKICPATIMTYTITYVHIHIPILALGNWGWAE